MSGCCGVMTDRPHTTTQLVGSWPSPSYERADSIVMGSKTPEFDQYAFFIRAASA